MLNVTSPIKHRFVPRIWRPINTENTEPYLYRNEAGEFPFWWNSIGRLHGKPFIGWCSCQCANLSVKVYSPVPLHLSDNVADRTPVKDAVCRVYVVIKSKCGRYFLCKSAFRCQNTLFEKRGIIYRHATTGPVLYRSREADLR